MKKNLKTPTRIVALRRQGFLRRMRAKAGRAVLSRRRKKGRKRLSI